MRALGRYALALAQAYRAYRGRRGNTPIPYVLTDKSEGDQA